MRSRSQKDSPEIHLQNGSKEADRLEIEFWDATNHWEHGGGTLPYEGAAVITAGAVQGIKGLSSTWGFPKIEVSVAAFDRNEKLLAKQSVIQKPPEEQYYPGKSYRCGASEQPGPLLLPRLLP